MLLELQEKQFTKKKMYRKCFNREIIHNKFMSRFHHSWQIFYYHKVGYLITSDENLKKKKLNDIN